jgi:DNA-binding response OmpR family regulator
METIMVQDTDPAVLEVLTLALEAEGFHVCPIKHCDEQILQLIDEVRPHVVMLDYKLDGEDCIKICQEIKSRYPHLPVVALSCNVNIHEKYSFSGFDDYIKKPFNLSLLYKVLRKHIKADA